ncbi:siderophore ABC transporter substrate-binding protein [Pseudomonas sp. LRF_L74]|uniref:siderophore ABC transporter substrate-binding protein n=1 Tax=Pseudomonas sp. LRF_L74 TaxID=3369422 RepID=UPI003F5E3936
MDSTLSRPLASLLILASLTFGLVSLAQAASAVEVQHAQGTTSLSQPPKRVVVLDLVALDDLDALGVDVAGVAGNTFPDYLERYGKAPYATLGTLFEPDYEALNRTRPDLIIVGGRSSAKFAQLSRIAPTIDLFEDNAQPVATTLKNLNMLAGIFGKQARAQELAMSLQQRLASVRKQTAERGRGLVVLVTGGKLSAYGPGSRFGLLHSELGVPVAIDGLSTSLHGESINAELIMKSDPDWLFVVDRDAAIGQSGAAQQVLDNALVRRTQAWKRAQVVYLDPINWYLVGGGIQALQRMIEQVGEAYGAGR